MTDTAPRKPKKSETLEVRLPHDTKQAFLTACREDGTTASEVVRDSIDGYLDARGRPQTANPARTVITMIPKPVRNWKYGAGALGAVGLVAFTALPSAANPDFLSAFKTMDANGDGVLTSEEFLAKRDGGGKEDMVRIETRVIKKVEADGAGAAASPGAKPEIQSEAFAFWTPGPEGGAAASGDIEKQREIRVEINRGDGDGADEPTVITMEDIRSSEFKSFDTDGDGKVSYAEYEAHQRAMLTRGFERLDADKNGSLSEAEYLKMGQPMAITMNWSSDDKDAPDIDIPEIKQASPDSLKAAFVKLDKNGDKKLSLQEYLPQT